MDHKISQDKVLLGRKIVNLTQTANSVDSKIISKILVASKTKCRHMTLEANRTKCRHRTSEANRTRCLRRTSVVRCLNKILVINRIQFRGSLINSINLMSMTRHKHLKHSKTCKTLSSTTSMTSKISSTNKTSSISKTNTISKTSILSKSILNKTNTLNKKSTFNRIMEDPSLKSNSGVMYLVSRKTRMALQYFLM